MNYTITAVSKSVRDFNGSFGPMKSYKLKLQELGDQTVELAQKAETPAPTAGQVLDGTVDMSGSHGPQFKKSFKPRAGGGGGRGRDSDEIKAEWAINAAITWLTETDMANANLEDVQPLASDFYAMVDRVKGSSSKPATAPQNASEDDFGEPPDDFDQSMPEDF